MIRAARRTAWIFLAVLVTVTVGRRPTAQVDRLRTIEFETTQVTAPDVAVSPTGEWLIFSMLGKLFRLSVNGGDAEQLTFGPHYDNDPTISPDGKLVAFQSDRDGSDGNIFVLTLGSREIRQLTRETWADRPAWAPDGQSLAYLQLDRRSWSYRDSPRPPSVVRRVSLAGGEPITVRSQDAVWSAFYLPDGRLSWTLVERNATSQEMTTRIEVRDHSGNVSELRAFDGIADPVIASHKADGFYARSVVTPSRHVLVRYFADGALLFAPLAGPTERRISPVSGERGGFAVAFDNATMYFGNLGHLWKVRLPGGRPENIAFRARVTLAVREPPPPRKWTPVEPGATVRPRTIQQPRLSPDGSRVVFRAVNRLWQQPIPGGRAQRLFEGDQIEFDPAFSPDGRQLAFVRETKGQQEIQVLDFESGKTRTVGPPGECGYEYLAWSPHGELVVTLGGSCRGQVTAIEPGTGLRRVLAETSSGGMYPQLPADGATVYFRAGSWLYSKRLDPAGPPQRLVSATGNPWGTNIVTNGRWVARALPNGLGIWLAPLASGGVAQAEARVLSTADGEDFAFTPDGSALLYVAGDTLWRESLLDGSREAIRIQLELLAPTPPPVLLERVRVLDFATGGFSAETSLMVENGRIQWIGSARGRALPPSTMTINAGGRFVIPGLFEMHGHGNGETDQYYGFAGCGGPAFIPYGVTSVRNMGGSLIKENAYADRADATSNALPRCFYAGTALDGFRAPLLYPMKEEDARTHVRRSHAQGAHFIKLYEGLPWLFQRAAADEARRLGLPVAAHGNTLEQVVKGVTLGYAWLTHFPHVHDDVLQMLAVVGTRWDPTLQHGLELFSRDDPERYRQARQVDPQVPDMVLRGFWAERLRTIRSAYRRGVILLPGTDSPPDGLALHWELEFFAEAGIPPLDILRLGTEGAAQTVGAQEHVGTIGVGKLADLVILEANPLEDIKNTQTIWRVLKGGWMFDPKVLRPQ
jgi:imidazolonepropionase-like amidohydrolase/Tol biopolymer transport system component